VPFLLSWPLLAGFFFWEAEMSKTPGMALVPTSFWKLRNVTLLMFVGLEVLAYWSVVQLPLLEVWEQVYGDSVIVAAVRALPNGIAAMCTGVVLPRLLLRLNVRYALLGGFLVSSVAFLLFIFSEGKIHDGQYWRWQFPGLIIGSSANAFAFVGINVTIMTAVPPEMSGVAGALVQVSYQIGVVIALSIQAGLLTIKPGSISNWGNVQASYWFQFGWAIFNAGIVAVAYRSKKQVTDAAAGRAEKAELKAAAGETAP